jgi:ABC-type proline/glycine betaine transport system ATPase subunit
MDNATPGGESNRIWFVKEGTVPPVGTPVEVVIKPAK